MLDYLTDLVSRVGQWSYLVIFLGAISWNLQIFDRFYRVNPARSQQPSGSGLGLAIVKSIMDLHGGTVSVQSEVRKGSIFTLKFPPAGSSATAPR